jgi:cysteinyl-tRNA synthetase
MHNGMIQLTGEKMAKSVGNIALLHEVIERYGHDAVVMYLISGHYRQPLAFGEAELEQARANIGRIREVGRRLGSGATVYRGLGDEAHLRSFREGFFHLLANDFNTPGALAYLYEWIRGAGHLGVEGDADLGEMLGVLGLEGLLTPAAEAPADVCDLAQQREQARAERDFAAADKLRDAIAETGWEVRDGPAGPELLPIARS